MSKPGRAARFLGIVAMLTALSAACGSSSSPSASTGSGSGHYGGTFTMLWNAAGSSIDPAIDYDSNWYILPLTNDGLVNWKRVNGSAGTQLTPDLATAIPTPTDGGKTYVFHMRKGIRFSDGREVVPSDVTYSLEREFKANGPGTAFYTDIVGGTACAAKPASCNLSAGVVANNANWTVTFHLTAPDPTLMQTLALPFAYVVPPGLPDHDIGTHPVPATGSYMIQSYVPGQQMVLVRNPEFHQWSALAQPKGYPNKIVMKIGLPVESEVTEVEQGQADWMYDQPPADRLPELSSKYASQVHIGPIPEVYYMALGTLVPPFNNLDARQAINYAVDRAALVKIWGGPTLNSTTCQVLPPGFPSYQQYCPYTTDPAPGGRGPWKGPDMAKARQLVAESGTRGQSIGVVTTTDSPSKAVGLYFVGLLDQLGYHAHLIALNGTIETPYVQTLKNDVKISFSYWDADFPDPSDWFNLVVGCGGIHALASDTSANAGGFCEPAIQAQTERALRLEGTDPAAASALWTQIDKMTTDQAAWVPLFVPKVVTFVSKQVGGYKYNTSTTGGYLFAQSWVN
jgi:peptide/nickel transport system substrate-binding protein